ncbi:MAG: sugar phosphate nucleotidyltransferase [bacterium]
MNIIIPMAGMGKRMRPHTLTRPKPLIKIAGKTIVQRLVEDIVAVAGEQPEHIGFVVGQFGDDVENELLDLARQHGAQGHIFYQDNPLGTGHAVFCAGELLKGPVIVAFADTLFDADFHLDDAADGIIWVKEVDDPSQFGVVSTDEDHVITAFIEKPDDFVSNKAIIGIYYFKEAQHLYYELNNLMDQGIIVNGEYQLTDALENLKNKQQKLITAVVKEWLDCGNVSVTLFANKRMLELNKWENTDDHPDMINSIVIEPCYIGHNVRLINSIVGPYVSVHDDVVIYDSRIDNSIVNDQAEISRLNGSDCMIGADTVVQQKAMSLDIGDFSKINI